MAVGVFASAITENQIIAAIISFAGLLVMWIADGIAGLVGGIIAKVLGWVSLLSSTRILTRSTGTEPDSILYFLYCGIPVCHGDGNRKRRWSQGDMMNKILQIFKKLVRSKTSNTAR